MAAAALQFHLVHPAHLACISSHILPGGNFSWPLCSARSEQLRAEVRGAGLKCILGGSIIAKCLAANVSF